jgi:phage-related protein
MSGWKVEFLEVARDEFVDWPDELKASLIRIFDRIEALGLDRVREPMVKHIEGRLWEMRPSGRNMEGRALYVAVKGRRVIVVLAFIKKTQKTPRRLIELALQRAELVQ